MSAIQNPTSDYQEHPDAMKASLSRIDSFCRQSKFSSQT